MKKRILILSVFILSSLDHTVLAQKKELPPPVMASQNDGGAPPPGLNAPIDSNIVFLLIGGLFIGGFFCYKKAVSR